MSFNVNVKSKNMNLLGHIQGRIQGTFSVSKVCKPVVSHIRENKLDISVLVNENLWSHMCYLLSEEDPQNAVANPFTVKVRLT